MKITFIGTGSAFTMRNYQTNALIERNGKKLLIDAGGDLRFALEDVGLSYLDIDAVYITHLHGDHIGGVEYLAFCNFFDPTAKNKIKLFSNYSLVQDMWNNTLRGGLASIQSKQMTLEDYFDVNPVFPNGSFEWEGVKFEIVQSVHIMNKYTIVPTYGLMITDPDTNMKIYYTGDTQFNPNQIIDFYKQADFILQDCETYAFKSGVHANFLDLITLDEDIVKKMALMHYMDNIAEDVEKFDPFTLVKQSPEYIKEWLETYCENVNKIKPEWNESAKGAGFRCWDGENYGFVKQGVVLDTREIKKKLDK